MKNGEKHLFAEIALAVSFACFLATSLFVRQSADDATLFTHYASRTVEIAVCFSIAFAARSSSINPRWMFRIAAGSLAAYLLCLYCPILIPALSPDNANLLPDALAGLFNGVLVACGMLLFGRMLGTVTPQRAAVLIPLAWASSHLIFLASLALPHDFIPLLQAALLIGALCGLRLVLGRVETEPASHAVSARRERIALASLLRSSRTFSLYFGMLVFPFFYGLMAQICTDAKVSSGLFDVSTEVVGIVFLVLLAASGPLWKGKLDAEGLFVVALPVFATALLFLPLFWESEVFVSGFIMKCGFLIYTALMWVQLQRMAAKAPGTSFFFFGIALGCYHLALMIGRLSAFALNTYTVLGDQTIATAALFAIWLLSMAALVMLFAHRRRAKSETTSPVALTDFDTACERIARTYGLSEREAVVVREFARGRTVAHIAEELIVSQETVRTHIKRAYSKTSCHNRQDLIDLVDQAQKEH